MSVQMCNEEGKLSTVSLLHAIEERNNTQGGDVLVGGTEQEHID
jgi:hypothetical protein